MLVISLALSMSLVLPSSFGSAKSLKSINKEIKETEAELEKSKENEKDIGNKIDQLNNKIQGNEQKIEEVKVQVNQAIIKYRAKEGELDQQRKKLKKGNDDLNIRLRKMYKNGGIGFMDVILSSEDVSSLVFNVEMVQKIYSSDRDLIMLLKKQYSEIKTARDKLKTAADDLQTKQNELSRLQNELTADKSELSDALDVARKKTADIDKHLDVLEEEAAALTRELQNVPTNVKRKVSKNYHSNGVFGWPVPGYHSISSGFGFRTDPINGGGFTHTGVDIPAPAGTTIVAAASGYVMKAGYAGSYGNRVIIMHGNGYATLYAHNSSLLVSSGQSVSKGQAIARCGTTGRSTGPHCHFEVRVNGVPRNPRNYL